MIAQISSKDTWNALEKRPNAVLVDVRTPEEWQVIGLPDLSSLNREVVQLTWAHGGEAAFAQGLADAVPDVQTPVYFLCRSGMRSQGASMLARHIGYVAVHNVSDGFEGPPDENGERGRVAGWQAAGLPARAG